MTFDGLQLSVFMGLTACIGLLTYIQCRRSGEKGQDNNKEIFLASGNLSWPFIAGSITLTNLSTDQLMGMNGKQMLVIAWWEWAAVIGLLILAKVFLPIYYKEQCTTTTELLEKKYGNVHVRSAISLLFLLGNVFIYLPLLLYSGALFMVSMFGLTPPKLFMQWFGTTHAPMVLIWCVAMIFALIGAAYALFGGLRAVAVSDTYSGVLLLGMAVLVVFLSLQAIQFDFSGIPTSRLALWGDDNAPIPWHTLLTGMLFIQIFYWSTNQTITQRAMAAPNLKEAQKGVYIAALIRFLIVPAIVVLPGIAAYKLYGKLGDQAYGHIVGKLLPTWLSGAFAAAIMAAVLTTFNSILNASSALCVCDLYEPYTGQEANVRKLNLWITMSFVGIALVLVPVYAQSESIIDLVQKLNGLLSMPILSVFILGLAFRDVDPRAAILALFSGVAFYAFTSFVYAPFHYIHMMLLTLLLCVCIALELNLRVFGKPIQLALTRNSTTDTQNTVDTP
ncbi:MAG: SLC5 family protein [Myxococcota bacterium]